MRPTPSHSIYMVLQGILTISGIGMFVILTVWLLHFTQAMRKSFKTWKALRGNSHDQERSYAIRMDLAKYILIVFFILAIFTLLVIFGIQNASKLTAEDKHDHKMEKHEKDKCKIQEKSWIWDKVYGNKHINWLEHGQWQPFALIAMITFEMVLLQILTSQYQNSRRLFTWQVKATFILGFIEFSVVFILNSFAESIMFGHVLFVFLLQLHLILIEFCLFKLYRVMKQQMTEMVHLKGKEYYELLRNKRLHQCFIIPQIIIIHGCVLVELLHTTVITFETIIVNRCWVQETYNFNYPIQIGETKDFIFYHYSRYAISLMRILLMLTLIIYNIIFNGIYCFKVWKRKQENKAHENTMHNEDDIERPLISGGEASTKE